MFASWAWDTDNSLCLFELPTHNCWLLNLTGMNWKNQWTPWNLWQSRLYILHTTIPGQIISVLLVLQQRRSGSGGIMFHQNSSLILIQERNHKWRSVDLSFCGLEKILSNTAMIFFQNWNLCVFLCVCVRERERERERETERERLILFGCVQRDLLLLSICVNCKKPWLRE